MTSSGERGFALVSAMWLLLLGGSLAALLTLRSITSARELAFEDRRHAAAGVADDAVETVAADLIFRGVASPWGHPPHAEAVTVGGSPVPVTVQSEATLPNVNEAPPSMLDAALAGLGLAENARATIVARAVTGRASRVGSLAEIAALGRGVLAPGTEPCLATVLSPFRAGAGGGAGTDLAVGSLLRVTVGDGLSRHAFVVRLVASEERPYALVDAYAEACPTTPQRSVT